MYTEFSRERSLFPLYFITSLTLVFSLVNTLLFFVTLYSAQQIWGSAHPLLANISSDIGLGLSCVKAIC
jgi:hypothetical protein